MKITYLLLASVVAPFALIVACSDPQPAPVEEMAAASPQQTLTVYSSRHYDSDKALFALFEAETGVKLDVRENKADQLLETMKAEGDQSPADIIIAADAGSLWRFQSAGLTLATSSDVLNELVPANYRDPDGRWFGVARRMRGVAFDPTRWSAEDVNSWDALAAPEKSGEICVRSSSNIYNLSLMSELIFRNGSEAAEAWARAVASNMARNPQGGDTDQIRAVAAGECSIAIVNHYYWVRLGESEKGDDKAAAAATQFLLPSFPDGGGAHVNITGAAIAATADDPDLAEQFLIFLLSDEGQRYLTMETKELPLLSSAPLPAGVEALPEFTASATPLNVLGENQSEAQRLFDLAGWN